MGIRYYVAPLRQKGNTCWFTAVLMLLKYHRRRLGLPSSTDLDYVQDRAHPGAKAEQKAQDEHDKKLQAGAKGGAGGPSSSAKLPSSLENEDRWAKEDADKKADQEAANRKAAEDQVGYMDANRLQSFMKRYDLQCKPFPSSPAGLDSALRRYGPLLLRLIVRYLPEARNPSGKVGVEHTLVLTGIEFGRTAEVLALLPPGTISPQALAQVQTGRARLEQPTHFVIWVDPATGSYDCTTLSKLIAYATAKSKEPLLVYYWQRSSLGE